MDATGLPVYNTAMGKGGIDEDVPTFGGFYAGAGSHPDVKKAVEDADLILWLGRYGVSLLRHGISVDAINHLLERLQHVSPRHSTRRVVVLTADVKSGEFTTNVKEDGVVDFQRFWVSVGYVKKLPGL